MYARGATRIGCCGRDYQLCLGYLSLSLSLSFPFSGRIPGNDDVYALGSIRRSPEARALKRRDRDTDSQTHAPCLPEQSRRSITRSSRRDVLSRSSRWRSAGHPIAEREREREFGGSQRVPPTARSYIPLNSRSQSSRRCYWPATDTIAATRTERARMLLSGRLISRVPLICRS